jgi:hypothetical protein
MGGLLRVWATTTLFLAAVVVVSPRDAPAFEVSTYSLPNQYEQHVLVTKHVGSLRQTVKTCRRLIVLSRVAAGYTPAQAALAAKQETTGEGCAVFDDNLTRCHIFVTEGRPWVTAHEERHCTEGSFH